MRIQLIKTVKKAGNYLALLFTLFLLSVPAYGQGEKLATTDDNIRVMLYSDGTWAKMGDPKPKLIKKVPISKKVISKKIVGDKLVIEYSVNEELKTREYDIQITSEKIEGSIYESNKKIEKEKSLGSAILTKATVIIGTVEVEYFGLTPYKSNIFFVENNTEIKWRSFNSSSSHFQFGVRQVGVDFGYKEHNNPRTRLVGNYSLMDAIQMAVRIVDL